MRFPRMTYLVLSIGLSGCVEAPVAPDAALAEAGSSGILILNEGLFGRDNSSLSFYNPASGVAEHSQFLAANPGFRLGDTGNSLLLADSILYVVMSGSNSVHALQYPGYNEIGRLQIDDNASLRHIALLSDTVAAASGLFTDKIYAFHRRRFEILWQAATGPAPEQLAVMGDQLFVANSGLGDLRITEPGAGSISVLAIDDGSQLAQVPVLPNLQELRLHSDGFLYALGSGLFAEDAISGMAIIDPIKYAVLDTIPIKNHPREMVLLDSDIAFVLTDSTVVRVDLAQRKVDPNWSVARAAIADDAWFYSLAISADASRLCLGNARNFTVAGEAVVLDMQGQIQFRFETGLNPGTLLFMNW